MNGTGGVKRGRNSEVQVGMVTARTASIADDVA